MSFQAPVTVSVQMTSSTQRWSEIPETRVIFPPVIALFRPIVQVPTHQNGQIPRMRQQFLRHHKHSHVPLDLQTQNQVIRKTKQDFTNNGKVCFFLFYLPCIIYLYVF